MRQPINQPINHSINRPYNTGKLSELRKRDIGAARNTKQSKRCVGVGRGRGGEQRKIVQCITRYRFQTCMSAFRTSSLRARLNQRPPPRECALSSVYILVWDHSTETNERKTAVPHDGCLVSRPRTLRAGNRHFERSHKIST